MGKERTAASGRVDLSGIVNDNHRHVIYGVVEEITVSPPKESLALQLMPPVNVPAAVLEHEIVSGSGGQTGERVLGAPGKSVSGPSSTSKLYQPGAYQDVTKFTETDLLKLRKLGTIGDRGITGLTGGELNWMERIAKKHKLRIQNRMAKLAWTALTAGTYTYQGVVKDFGIPAANKFAAASDWSQ
ncbi:MAG: major capsid protein, partial [Bdellovibrionota bacterium]